MVTFALGDRTDRIYEREGVREIGETEFPRDGRRIRSKRPAVELREEHLRLDVIERRDVAFARHALLSREIHTHSVPERYTRRMKRRARLRLMFDMLIDVLMPRRERSTRVRHAVQTDFPLSPRAETIGGTRIVTLAPYHEQLIEDAIRALKYDGDTHAARLLAGGLADYLQEELASLRAFSPRPVILVPVPLHGKRRRERGFNQIEKMLAKLPAEMREGPLARVETRALFRTRATPPQTRLHRSERLTNVAGAFSADEKRCRGAHAIVIDDVCTTGSTLRECVKTLERAGAKASALALARA